MRIDSHQHFWSYSAAEYPWMQDGWEIRRDFLPPDLVPLLDAAQLDGSIAVQARQTLEENRFLLDLAERHEEVLGVVGWVDLRSESVEAQLAEFAAHPKYVGVRHVVQDEPDDEFLLRPDFLRGIGRLLEFGLTYDLLLYPRQLPAAVRFVEQFPEQPFVLDHLAKPSVRDGRMNDWLASLRELARHPHVYCKLSGLVTEARWNDWKPSDFQPYLEAVWEAFGPSRLMFGSDWPVCLLAGEYVEVVELIERFVSAQGPAARDGIFGANAERFYLNG